MRLLARNCYGEIAGFQYFGLGEGEITAVGGHAVQNQDY